MAHIHVALGSESHFKKSIDAVAMPVLDIVKPIKAWIKNNQVSNKAVAVPVLSARDSKKEVVKVLEKAAKDNSFIARLTYEGSRALQGYHLTPEEKAAIVSGDIRWIETHVGKLDDRQSKWLWCKLQQEIW